MYKRQVLGDGGFFFVEDGFFVAVLILDIIEHPYLSLIHILLKLPVPKANFHTEVIKPSEIQKEMIKGLAERAEKIRGGGEMCIRDRFGTTKKPSPADKEYLPDPLSYTPLPEVI